VSCTVGSTAAARENSSAHSNGATLVTLRPEALSDGSHWRDGHNHRNRQSTERDKKEGPTRPVGETGRADNVWRANIELIFGLGSYWPLPRPAPPAGRPAPAAPRCLVPRLETSSGSERKRRLQSCILRLACSLTLHVLQTIRVRSQDRFSLYSPHSFRALDHTESLRSKIPGRTEV
jgi:hypothetical protein